MALTEREELEMLELEEREKAFPAKPIVSEQPKEEDGVIESFGKGMIGREGEGVAHAIGGAVLPTAGAVIGSLAPGVGTVLGAAAGQTVKEAANAWMPGEPTEEHPLSPVGRVVLAGGLQGAGDKAAKVAGPIVSKYSGKIFEFADDAINWSVNTIGKLSDMSAGTLDVIRKDPSLVFKKIGKVGKFDLEDAADGIKIAIKKLGKQEESGDFVLDKILESSDDQAELAKIVKRIMSNGGKDSADYIASLLKKDNVLIPNMEKLGLSKPIESYITTKAALDASRLPPLDAFSLGSAATMIFHAPVGGAALAARVPAVPATMAAGQHVARKVGKAVAESASKAVGKKTSAAASQALSQAAIEGIDGSVELDKDELNKRLEE